MKVRFQAIFLILAILISSFLTDYFKKNNFQNQEITVNKNPVTQENLQIPPSFYYQTAALKEIPLPSSPKKLPERNWQVYDPQVNSEAVLIESLDDHTPFFYYQTYKPWPLASITKLLTAVVALENVGASKKIEITPKILEVGNENYFKIGEIYNALDLIKAMIINSSNEAAIALAEFYGQEEFIKLLNEKALELNMTQTKIVEPSGISPKNISTAVDISKLIKYIIEKYPEILNWSRLPYLTIQPLNKIETKTLKNNNYFVENKNFWGGKTGTSPQAKENLAAVFSFKNHRLLIIILGSNNRIKETESLMEWVDKAYVFY